MRAIPGLVVGGIMTPNTSGKFDFQFVKTQEWILLKDKDGMVKTNTPQFDELVAKLKALIAEHNIELSATTKAADDEATSEGGVTA